MLDNPVQDLFNSIHGVTIFENFFIGIPCLRVCGGNSFSQRFRKIFY